MSLQTAAMRKDANRMVEICQDKETKLYHGMEFVNHPTPSGCERWLPTVSDKRGWPTKEQAAEEFEKLLTELDKAEESMWQKILGKTESESK